MIYINDIQEAIFESGPQIILSMGWILKASLDGAEISQIIVISTIFSLWSLTSKVASDDKMLFDDYGTEFISADFKFKDKFPFIYFHWQYFVRVIFWRFLEITGRINLCVLIWINVGGLSLSIILSIEILICLILCLFEKSYVTYICIYTHQWSEPAFVSLF